MSGRRHSGLPWRSRDPPFPDLGGEQRAEAVPPKAHSLVADVDAAFGQQVLDVAQGQRVVDIQHDRQADHLGGTVEIFKRAAYLNGLRMCQATAQCRRDAT